MSDETPKVEPCAWCGKPPRAKQHYAFPERIDYDCRTDGCFENYGSSLWEWNAKQARILAARRKDFEAGRSIGFKQCAARACDDPDDVWGEYLARGGDE